MNTPSISWGGVTERFFTLHADPADPVPSLLGKLERVLEARREEVLEIRIFADSSLFPVLSTSVGKLAGAGDWPLSLLDGTPSPRGGIAGLQLHTVDGTEVETLRLDGQPVGRAFETEDARFVVLGGLGPAENTLGAPQQTTQTLLRMEEALGSQGMNLLDLVRTWFFLDDILGWYGEFNGARTRIFEDRGVFDAYVPASTGIGGRNHLGSALVASALAMTPKGPGTVVEEIPSPLQCSAGEYGSSFSRAAEFRSPDHRRVLVSGTASIAPEGHTAHLGDVEAQIDLTFRVVEAILRSRGSHFGEVLRGNAYFRDVDNAPALTPRLEAYGLPLDRLIVSQDAVCRDDLLFEMEVEAVCGSSAPDS